LLNKLPTNLALYNYEAFSYKDMQRAVTYFQTELGKIEKLLSKLPTITQESKTNQVNSSVENPYINLYGGQTTSQNQVKPSTKPEIVAPPLPYSSYRPGLLGEYMEMPIILSSSGEVKSNNTSTANPFNEVETVKLSTIEDNSNQLGSELKQMLS
jgi:hypothetical protein